MELGARVGLGATVKAITRLKHGGRRTVGGAKSSSISPDSLNLYNSPHGASSPNGAAALPAAAPAPLEAEARWLEEEARRAVKESERRTRPTVPPTSPPEPESPESGEAALPALPAVVAAVPGCGRVPGKGRARVPALSSAGGAGACGGACAAAAAAAAAAATGATVATVGAGVGAGVPAAPTAPAAAGAGGSTAAHPSSTAIDTLCVVPTATHGAGMSLPKIGSSLAPELAAHGETDLRVGGGSQIRLMLPLISLLSLLPLAVTGCCSQKAGGGGGVVFGMEGAEDAQPWFGRAAAGGLLRDWLPPRTVAQPISQPISEGGTDGGAGTACEKA